MNRYETRVRTAAQFVIVLMVVLIALQIARVALAITTGDYGHIFDIVTITALAVTVILAQRGRS